MRKGRKPITELRRSREQRDTQIEVSELEMKKDEGSTARLRKSGFQQPQRSFTLNDEESSRRKFVCYPVIRLATSPVGV